MASTPMAKPMAAVSLCLGALLLALLASASAAPGPAFSKLQSKPRTIRGFKNVVLSTARNFGKRAGPSGAVSSADGLQALQAEFVDEAALQANGADYQRPPANR